MPIPALQIQGLNIDQDGDMHISYVLEEHVKANGIGIANTMLVPAGTDYDQEMQNVLDAIIYLIGDVLEDMPRLRSAAEAEADATLAEDQRKETGQP